MIYLESTSTNPYYNLALEEYIFSRPGQNREYALFWQSKNAIFVSRNQNTAAVVNQQYVDRHNTRVARRLSGGGAVYQDEGDLHISLILNRESCSTLDSSIFTTPILHALESYGITAELGTNHDLLIDGQSFADYSLFVKRKRVLYHGFIRLHSNPALALDALRTESEEDLSHTGGITTVSQHTESPVSLAQFQAALKEIMQQTWPEESCLLTAADREGINRLLQNKYETWEWNYAALG